MALDLYDTDFIAWTKAQAEALRARGAGSNALDYDRLAEEIEDVGKSETRAAESLTVQILIHLLKLALLPDDPAAGQWRAEVVAFRDDLDARLTPSLRVQLPQRLEPLYGRAARRLAALWTADGIDIAPPATCPFTFDDVLGRGADWTPGADG